MSVIGIIPARYKSSRFLGKMLHPIHGKSLLQRTFEAASESKLLDKLVIATDHDEIFQHAKSFGAEVYMTSKDCLNGTVRLVDAIQRYPELQNGSIYVNIQGDRPCLPVESIDACILALQESVEAVLTTPIVAITDENEFHNRASVKCVIDKEGYALYFSREPIRGFKHVGLYAFRKEFLFEYVKLSDTPLMLHEDLEQLKVLEHGYRIKTVEVKDFDLSVDTPEDVEKVEQWLTQNSSL